MFLFDQISEYKVRQLVSKRYKKYPRFLPKSRIMGRSAEAQAAPQPPSVVDPDSFHLSAITDPAIAEGLPCIPDPDPQKGKRDTKAPNAKSSQQRIEKAFDTVFRIPQGSDVEHILTEEKDFLSGEVA